MTSLRTSAVRVVEEQVFAALGARVACPIKTINDLS